MLPAMTSISGCVFLDPFHHFDHAPGMAVRGVHRQRVHLALGQDQHPLLVVGSDGRSDAQPVMRIAIVQRFDIMNQGLDIRKAVEADQFIVFDERQLPDFVLHHDVVGLLQGGVAGGRHDLFRHDFFDPGIAVSGEPDVASGENADQFVVIA
jgi:hypothetical protein